MRIEAGPNVCHATDGSEIHVDQPLSTRQVDQLLGFIDTAGQTVDTVTAVDIVDETTVDVLWRWPDDPTVIRTTTIEAR